MRSLKQNGRELEGTSISWNPRAESEVSSSRTEVYLPSSEYLPSASPCSRITYSLMGERCQFLKITLINVLFSIKVITFKERSTVL